MGNQPSFGDQIRVVHQKTKELNTETAMDQYKIWCQRIDWMNIIRQLGDQSRDNPAKYLHLEDIAKDLNLKKLKKHAREPSFVAEADKYISKMCREKYGVKCTCSGTVTTVYLYD